MGLSSSVVLLVLLLSSSVAHAQPPTLGPSNNIPLKLGQTIWVTGPEGREVKGTVRGLSPGSFDLDTRGTVVRFDLATIERIEKRDSLRDGVQVGGILGAVVGAAYGVALVKGFCGDCSLGSVIFVPVTGAAVFGLVGMGYGALIDWVIPGRTRLYSKSLLATRATLTPVLSPGRYGLMGAIRW